MKGELLRGELKEQEFHWSHVGPQHERTYLNLLAINGYAPAKESGRFLVYNMGGIYLAKTFATIPAAKRAAKRNAKEWIQQAAKMQIEWIAADTGVHFEAKINGITIASYYKCDEARGGWHKGFKVYFGGTYYITEFKSVDEAKAAISTTWEEWLTQAKGVACLN